MTKSQIAFALIASAAANAAMAGANGLFVVPRALPTLGEVGLGLLIALLGVAGGFLARRKK
ncbi:MAG: IPTL-CTERM sorting domain-containing protein [Betaproteobacteria bacterium]